MSAPHVLESIAGGGAGAFLEAAARSGHLGHAYLFVGPAGSGRLEAARALAAVSLCPSGGCGSCDTCGRIMRGSHPDVHELSPQSSQGYLVSQIRDLIADLDLAPVMAVRRAYVIDAAERLTPSSANALLKSLEEPPGDAMFILLASTAESVLPTIVSRCQVVPFAGRSADEAAQALAREALVPLSVARRAIACCASPAAARDFVRSDERAEARRRAIDCLAMLPDADELDILGYAREAVLASKAPLAEFKSAQQAALEENSKILGPSGLRELEERQKRELSSRERSGIMESFAAQRSFLRDVLETAAGRGSQPVCDDYAAQIAALAGLLGIDGASRAVDQVELACSRVAGNVSPQLAMESMLFTVKEMLTCQR